VVQLQAGVREMYLLKRVQVDSGVNLVFYLMGTGQLMRLITLPQLMPMFKCADITLLTKMPSWF
jgi:hypothetical protein